MMIRLTNRGDGLPRSRSSRYGSSDVRIRVSSRYSPLCNSRHSPLDRLEHATVARRRNTRPTLEKSPEERGILVPDRKADLVNRLVCRFQQVLRLFDAKVLHVIDEGEAGRLLWAHWWAHYARCQCVPLRHTSMIL